MQLAPPCFMDPASWDLDRGEGVPHTPIEQLIQACRTQCPRLAWCQDRAKGEEIYGVVAGEYRPWPATAQVDALHRAPVLRRLVAALRAEIAELEPGQLLPTQTQLATDFGVSRHAVRAALRWLAEEDVLLKPATRAEWYRVPLPRKVCAA